MTDAITVLTTDHREIDALFSQVEGSVADQDVVDQIVRRLSIHDAIEKEYLYPALRNVEGGDAIADRSVEEHNQQAKDLLAVDKADDGSTEQAELLTKLIRETREHVAAEEEETFSLMRRTMSQEELEELGGKLEGGKASAPTRPHPMAPSEGLGTKVAGAMSAPLDKARDAVQGRND